MSKPMTQEEADKVLAERRERTMESIRLANKRGGTMTLSTKDKEEEPEQ